MEYKWWQVTEKYIDEARESDRSVAFRTAMCQ